jgi:hypothetical protein
MNLGIVISYIIAGMIMLGIVMMNINVQNSSAELTITQITRSHVSNVTEIINDDFSNIGYDVNRTTADNPEINAIMRCKLPRRVEFYRNIYDDPNEQPKRIEWRFFHEDEIPGAKNENFRLLQRTVYNTEDNSIYDQTDILTGVTRFEVLYFDQVGKPRDESLTSSGGCSDIGTVKQIHIILEMQSPEKIYNRASGEGRYIRSVWDKRFTPPNLNL